MGKFNQSYEKAKEQYPNAGPKELLSMAMSDAVGSEVRVSPMPEICRYVMMVGQRRIEGTLGELQRIAQAEFLIIMPDTIQEILAPLYARVQAAIEAQPDLTFIDDFRGEVDFYFSKSGVTCRVKVLRKGKRKPVDVHESGETAIEAADKLIASLPLWAQVHGEK